MVASNLDLAMESVHSIVINNNVLGVALASAQTFPDETVDVIISQNLKKKARFLPFNKHSQPNWLLS